MTRYSLLLALAMVLSGCRTSGHFRSMRDQVYEGKLERVLLAYSSEKSSASLGRDFLQRVVSRLSDSLARRNVTAASVPIDSSALDPAAPIKAAAASFSPAQVLYFRVARINSSSSMRWTDWDNLPHYSHTMVATLECSVFDSKTDKTIWRTEVDYYSAPRPEDVADALIEQLRAARLL